MILQKIKKSIEKIGIPCFLDYNDATSYCAVLIPETNGKESIKVDIQFIWEDGNPILLADEWIKSLRMNKELKAIVLGSGNNYAGYVLRVKVIDVSICSYIPTGNRYTITIVNDSTKGTVSGAGKYLEGKTCTLTAYPLEQYYFVGWLTPDDDVVHENPYSFTVEGDATYESYFLSKYHVEVVSAGNGTVSGSGYYGPTESCTITATPNTHYHFVNWTVSGLELTTDNPYTFIPTGDITITANFIPYYDISVSSSGNGSVSGGGTYNSGETVSLTATPNEGYVFVNWTENGVEVSTSNPYTFTCTENRTIVGNFAANPLKITTNASSSVDLINANNQTYTWNLTAGLNEYYGDEPGFALNEITGLKKTVVNSWDYAIVSVDASVLTSWTTVKANSFRLCQNLDTFVLPDTITTIGGYSFQQCGLTSINFPDGLTSIGSGAFHQCHLSSISVPASLTSINSDAFSQVAQYITTITVDSNNAKYNDGNGSNILIETDTNTLVLGNNSSSSVVVPSGITVIGQNAFANCKNITSITLPDSLTTINNWAFINCSYLESISIPANVSTLVNPFPNCSGLTSITVDSNNAYYNDGNGNNCIIETSTNKLIRGCDSTIIPNTVVALGDGAFSNCTFTSITLPSSLTTIGQNALAGCQKLATLTIPASVSSIGHSAFWGDNLIYMEFEGTTPATLETTSIFTGSYPLYVPSSAVSAYQTAWPTYADRIMAKPQPSGSDYLEIISKGQTSVILTNSSNQTYTWNVVQGINYYEGTEPGFALNEITGLKKSTSGWDNYLNTIDASKLTSWTTVENSAFQYNYMTSITLPASITTIGDYAFNNCTSLTSINLPNSITSIGESAFNQCRSLTNLTLPNSLTTIGNNGFQYCSGLTSIILPNSLTTIGNYAFSVCSSLTSITLPEGLTTIGNQILTNCPSLTSLTIPSSVSSIGGSLTVNSPVSEVYCLPTTPPGPSGASMAFNDNSTVYIPNGSLSAYQNGGWRWMFYNYVELP